MDIPANTGDAHYSPEFTARLAELSGQTWTVIKEAAEKVGVPKKEGQPWADLAYDIIFAEFKRDGKEAYVEQPAILKTSKEVASEDGDYLTSQPLTTEEFADLKAEVESKASTQVEEIFPTRSQQEAGHPICSKCGSMYRYDRFMKQYCALGDDEAIVADCPAMVGTKILEEGVDRRVEVAQTPVVDPASNLLVNETGFQSTGIIDPH